MWSRAEWDKRWKQGQSRENYQRIEIQQPKQALTRYSQIHSQIISVKGIQEYRSMMNIL